MMRIPCAIFDIDGTLADHEHRRHFIDHANYTGSSKEGWAKFFAGIPDDPLIEPVAVVLDALSQYYASHNSIVLCTGRSESNRAATERWLAAHGVRYDSLYMRETDCFRDDAIVKSKLLDKILADGYEPFIVFEDRQRVVDMWRSRGLVCAQVAPGNF